MSNEHTPAATPATATLPLLLAAMTAVNTSLMRQLSNPQRQRAAADLDQLAQAAHRAHSTPLGHALTDAANSLRQHTTGSTT